MTKPLIVTRVMKEARAGRVACVRLLFSFPLSFSFSISISLIRTLIFALSTSQNFAQGCCFFWDIGYPSRQFFWTEVKWCVIGRPPLPLNSSGYYLSFPLVVESIPPLSFYSQGFSIPSVSVSLFESFFASSHLYFSLWLFRLFFSFWLQIILFSYLLLQKRSFNLWI